MKQEGFDVRVASDGTTALRLVESEPPDLVVLDVMLPRRDGYDVCQAIRANRRLDGVKIMMLSAKCRELDRRKGLELGADDYVTKPFSTRDLVGRARALRSEEHTSELQSLMRISYAVFCLKKKKNTYYT